MARLTFAAAVMGCTLLGHTAGPTVAQPAAPRFEDLQGATIEAEIVYTRKFRRDGQIRSNDNHSRIKLTIGPGDAIEQTFTVTIVARDGHQINSRSSTLPFTLNKPRDSRNGAMVWVFEDGSLTRLQKLVSGARRISISFARSGSGLTCSVNAAFAREDGVGEIETTSVVREGSKVVWLDIKQTSTNCRIAKP